MKIKRIFFLIISLMIASVFSNVCFASEAKFEQAVYYDDTQEVVLRITGLNGLVGKEAAIAMFDTKNSVIPVYFAQPKIDENGELNYTYLFSLPEGRTCEEYSISVNAHNVVKLTATPKSVYDKKCKVYIENLEYSVGEGKKVSLTDENISDLYGKDVNIFFDIKGMGASVLDATVIAALKVDEHLEFVKILYDDSIEFEQSVPLNFDVIYPENAELEIYVWDMSDNSAPLREVFSVKETKSVAFSLVESNEQIYTNPGKGYLRYSITGTQSEDVLEYTSAGYARFSWAELEPSEGVYNWQPIDDAIDYWKAYGKGFAFGVINANTASYTQYITPKWVFDAGAQYTQTTLANGSVQYTPVWNDSVFIQKVTNFVNALAERYDGNDSVEFIDIRSYGNYGEFHVGNLNSTALSLDDRKKHVDIYANAFDKTNLMMNVNKAADTGQIAKYAVSRGVGLRNDGIANNAAMAGLTLAAKGETPVALEFATNYSTLKNNVANITSANADRVWNERSYVKGFELSTANYMDLGQYNSDSALFVEDNEELIKEIADRMGYKFALKDIKIHTEVKNGATCGVTTAWENSGVSYLYRECNIALAVLDEAGNEIFRAWLDNTDAGSFSPGNVVVCSDRFDMWNLNDGEYTLAIGLFMDKANQMPDYRICNTGRMDSGWYPVAEISCSNGVNVISEMDGVSTLIDNLPVYQETEQYIPDGELIADYQITESDFEWTGKNGADVEVTSTDSYSGAYSGRIYNRNGALYGAQLDITEKLAANGPGTYRMTGRFKGRNGVGIGIYLGYLNAGAISKSTDFHYAGSNWTELTQEFTVTASDISSMAQASLLIVGRDGVLYSGDVKKDIYFDDVRITKIK